MKNNGSNGTVVPNVKKVQLDAQAEHQVSEVVKNMMVHLDKKQLTCPEKTKDEIERFLTNSGYHKVVVRKNDWPANREADYFVEFSFDGTIVENKKITRNGLIYRAAPVTA